MKITLDDLPAREIIPGFHGRMVHTGSMTLAYWTIEAGAVLPEHQHPHEQVVNMFEGTLDLSVGGQPHRLGPGDVLVIPGNTLHSGRAVTAVRVLDVFNPERTDYKA
jgi:quercetin dioxygenase-like cupin family protein